MAKQTIDLGKWSVTNGGDYDPSVEYEQLTLVTYNYGTYMTLKTVKGITPTDDGVNYNLVAQGFNTQEPDIAYVEAIALVDSWTNEYPFEQTINVPGLKDTDVPVIGIIYPNDCTRAQQKAINKASSYIYQMESITDGIIVKCTVRPESDITFGINLNF